MKHDTDWFWIAAGFGVACIAAAAAYADHCMTVRAHDCFAAGMRWDDPKGVCLELQGAGK